MLYHSVIVCCVSFHINIWISYEHRVYNSCMTVPCLFMQEYSELKLENLRLRNELQAQKELYERCLEDFAKLLESLAWKGGLWVDMNTMYESKVVDKPISKTSCSLLFLWFLEAKLQSPPPVVAPTHKPTSSNQKVQQRRTDAKSQASVSSNCIQEIEKNTLTVPLVSKFTER